MSLKNIIFYLLAAFIAGTLVLVFVQYNFSKSISNLQKINRQYVSEYNINSVLRELEKNVIKIESDISGFVSTGNKDFVKEIDALIKGVEENMDSLQRVVDDSASLSLVNQLNQMVFSKLEFSKSLLNTSEQEGRNAAGELIKTLEGKQLMESVFDCTRQIKAVRYDYLERLNASSIRNGKRAENLNYILIGLTLACAAILFWYIISIIQRLIESEKKVKEAAKVKENFLTNMSHEIRTPMNAILGFTSLLERQELNELSKEYVHTIQTSGENLLSIINDILDLSKIESGMMRLESVSFSVRGLFHSISVMFGSKVAEKNLIFRINVDDDIPDILEGDATRFTQILMNLIGNAIKFTRAGSVTVDITNEERIEEMIKLGVVVKDTGIGIEKEKLDKIFDRFQQADEAVTRKYGGTGLGLSIVKELAALLKGQIEVDSLPDKGTTFQLIIPFKIAENQTLREEKKFDSEEKSANGSFKDKRILVAEDNEINQSLIRHLFKAWEVDFDLARNGKEAIEKLKHNNYDLVLMDIQMPEMDGYTAVKEIRETLHLTTPVIAMTAHALAGEREKCLSLGMDEYIAKPIRESRLRQLMTQFTKPPSGKDEQQQNLNLENSYQYISLNYMKEISGGDLEYEKEVTSQFLEVVPATLSAIKKAWDRGDFPVVKHFAHDMKTTVSIMGLTELLNPVLETLEYENLSESSFSSAYNFLQSTCNMALSEAADFLSKLK